MGNGKLTFEQAILMSKTLGAVVVLVLGAYAWMFATFVSAADFEEYIATADQRELAHNLDRVGGKIDDLDSKIFNIKELIREESTAERRKQLNKYETALAKNEKQQNCFVNNGKNCRKIGD